MVLAVLVNRYAPSSRGLMKPTPDEAAAASARDWGDHYDGSGYRNLGVSSSMETTESGIAKEADDAGPQKKKNKPFRAIAALTSLASDLDVISDWLFYRETLKNNREYQADEGAPGYLIPPLLMTFLLVVCIIGTVMWLILATDGRILTPLLKRCGVEKISMGYMLFLCVVVEDLPQVVLTFLVEDYYEDDENLSNFAVMNLTVSLYDTLIKLAEAYDERNDVVETGVWCKNSLWAHYETVTSVLAIPLPPSTKETTKRRRFLQRALRPVAVSELPRLRFLTTSSDKTIRLWDTAVTMTWKSRQHCVHTFRGHLDEVTCVALLRKSAGYHTVHPEHHDLDLRDEEDTHNTFFITGCKNGNGKLWNLHGDCVRNYYLPRNFYIPDQQNSITSVAIIKRGVTFVCGYEDGTACLWEAWSGICIGTYNGHSGTVSSVCSMEDGIGFLSGSHDETIKLWDVSAAMQALTDSCAPKDSSDDQAAAPPVPSSALMEGALHEEFVCNRTFRGHTDQVLALACVEQGHGFVSGSADGTARLWSLRKKSCLRIFSEHRGPIRSIACLDQVTFLTGSDDTTIKVWSALSSISLRTYEGHKDRVTAISVSQDDTTFLSASADRTVKVWVLTTIPKEDPEDEDDDLFDINDLVCGSANN